jgi:hypothetical protein
MKIAITFFKTPTQERHEKYDPSTQGNPCKFVYSGRLKTPCAVPELDNPNRTVQVMRGLGENPTGFE